MIRLLSSLAALVFALAASAQTNIFSCGTSGATGEMLMPRLERNLRAMGDHPALGRTVSFVPVHFFLVAESNGDDRILESDVYEQLCALNEDYAPMNIQFYIKNKNETLPQGSYTANGLTYINNSVIFNDHTSSLTLMNNLYRDDNAINIWILANATPAGGTIGQTLGYYSPQFDWVVMLDGEVNAGSTTLSHELGHFFSLPHPHRGWDSKPFIPDPVPQWAINEGFTTPTPNPVPATAPDGIPTEKMSGSNCTTAGDKICDTPPDYNGFGWLTCNFSAGAMDPDGVLIDPQEKLFMGYFGYCPVDDYFFSDMQQQIIMQDYASTERDYLRTGYSPNPTALAAGCTNIAPANNQTLSQFNEIFFQWSEVPGAERYLLEISRNSTYPASTTLNYVVSGTSKIVTDLEANRNYYFRVRPLTDYSSCVAPSSNHFFKTGSVTATAEPAFVKGWKLWPNPLVSGQPVAIELNAAKAFSARIEILSLDGRQVVSPVSRSFKTGNNRVEIPAASLPSGVYWVKVNTAEGQFSKKIVVGK
ncbi:MAG TPA: T9SS type A sorting domain-containing protein [Flavilitoribacter sp.]|nr:T9SS type A sorting domain-containing protein [Flavilitoribacter sp.]HMQ87590.1 T9SS type A sorting domain-containing protein [Flavilitoribacter sp.]